MWTWLDLFLTESYRLSRLQNFEVWASVMTFAVIGIGGLGNLLADRWGRSYVTIMSMAISGLAAVTIGFVFGGSPILISIIALIWGFVIVADSAQFSTAVSESVNRKYMGTALMMETSLGFLLTLVSIRLSIFNSPQTTLNKEISSNNYFYTKN